jgi:ubiquinone/menaquinone biosynthesis C-methylase UbiE
MDIEYAESLLKETRKNYNLTAESYTRTRAFIPEDINSLSLFAEKGDRILDSGCASGRLYGLLKDRQVDYVGVDFSERLIEIAKNSYPEADFQLSDVLKLPFPDNYFDKIFSISVIHNIPSGYFQLQYLKETIRVLKPGGMLILRVWDLWKRKASFPLLFKYTFLKIFGKSKLISMMSFCHGKIPGETCWFRVIFTLLQKKK